MKVKRKRAFNTDSFLRSAGPGKNVATYRPMDVIFSQGDACGSVMYIQEGTVKISVLSRGGKEAVVATLERGDFFGERALMGHPVRLETATAIAATTVLMVPKQQMTRLLHDDRALVDRFIAHMLARNTRIEQDLVDQLFNSSEKRLAGRCCGWRDMARQARRIRCGRESLRRRSPRWSGRRPRA